MLTLKKRIKAFETKCQRKLLRISYLEHQANDWVRSKINCLVGPQEPFLATVKRRKLAWFVHVTRHDSKKTLTTASPKPSSGHLGEGATLWSAEEMLNGEHQVADILAHARTAHKGLLQKRLGQDLC